MEDIIRVLPDSIANQIAAGEVIQRPASVMKELMENAIDAGATRIDVRIKDAGRSLIQVMDNGKGMSPADAKIAFERHATSKLHQAEDLFHLTTMGFRGEALASIAAVAYVELVTRRSQDELAWKVEIEGSAVKNEEPTLAAPGSRFAVRNLFYNVPARRKFLGDNMKELRYIRDEFIQIALVYPDLELSLTHNDDVFYQLSPSVLKQRVLALFGKRSGGQLNRQLYPVDVKTQLVNISGFVGDPAAACQRDPMQYFFVNGRFIHHKYFRSAVLKAYETLLPNGMQPAFFLYFDVEPEALDVNIHPTKTEVKFEHEQAIWPIIQATVREALGKFNAIPSIDFDQADAPDIQVYTEDRTAKPPQLNFNPSYNPFKSKEKQYNPDWDTLLQGFHKTVTPEKPVFDQETSPDKQSFHEPSGIFVSKGTPVYESLAQEEDEVYAEALPSDLFPQDDRSLENRPALDPAAPKFQLFGSYVAVHNNQTLLLIDQHRAHVRVLFERYKKQLKLRRAPSQALLFPAVLHLDDRQRMDLQHLSDDLQALGFLFDMSGESVEVSAIPVDSQGLQLESLVLDLLHAVSETGINLPSEHSERLALKMANKAAIPYDQVLGQEELDNLVAKLMDTSEPTYTPDGKRVYCWVTQEALQKLF